MKRNYLGPILITGIFVCLAAGMLLYYRQMRYAKVPVPETTSIRDLVREDSLRDDEVVSISENDSREDMADESSSSPEETEPVEIPEELNLSASFFSQAPLGNWDYPWQEACEEASVLLVANEYFGHNWTAEEFNEEILALVDWEMERFGQYEHTSVDETVEMLQYLGLDAAVHEDPTFEDVQEILARGHLIVMTFSGKELGNPFFTNGGPVYHALVVKGYTADGQIITHDDGRKRGADYVYSWPVIEQALRDYAEPIQLGPKRYIEVLPPSDL